MKNPHAADSDSDRQLDRVIAEYLVRIDRGEAVSCEVFLDEHPELAAELRSFFESADLVDSIVAVSGRSFDDSQRSALMASASQETIGPTDTSEPKVVISPAARSFPDIPRYRFVRALGQGAMGTVALAHDTQLDRPVAIKVPSFAVGLEPDSLERFYREARAAATLNHPHVCPIHDIGECDGLPYIAMAYIQGRTLSELLRSGQGFAFAEVVAIIRKLAGALHEAHAKGIIHRDLKSGNVMIDQRGEPIVMDFGLACRLQKDDVRLTKDGSLLGTPAYMSPEQVDADIERIGSATDIYSLGVIFYELLTGGLPFQGSLASVLWQICSREPKRPAAIRQDVPPALETLCLQMLAKRPADRPATMADIVMRLHAISEHATHDNVAQQLPAPENHHTPERSHAGCDPSRQEADLVQRGHRAEGRQAARRQAERTRPQSTSRVVHTAGSPPRRLKQSVLLSSGGTVLLLGMIVLYLQLGEGTVTIEIDDSLPRHEFSVRLDGDGYSLEGIGQPVRLRPGMHALRVERAGLETETRDFSLKRGEEVVLHVRWLDGKVAITDSREPAPKSATKPIVGPMAPIAAKPTPVRPTTPATIAPPLWVAPDATLPGLIPKPAAVAGIRGWQIETVAPRGEIHSVAWSPDGRFVACGSADGQVRTYDADLRLVRIFCGHTNEVQCVAWSPDGQHLASAGLGDKTARIWSVEGTPGPVMKHSERVWSVCWSPDGKRLASGCSDARLRVWNADGDLAAVMEPQSHPVWAVAWSPDGDWIAATDKDDVRLWKPDGTGGPVLKGHTGNVASISWNPDGKLLASGSYDGTVRLWNVDGNPGAILKAHESQVWSVAWSSDGQWLASCGNDQEIRLWKSDGTPDFVLETPESWPTSLAWSPDGKRVASGSGENILALRQVDGSAAAKFIGYRAELSSLAWSLDGERIAAGANDEKVRIWHPDGTPESVLFTPHVQIRVAFSPDSRQLATGDTGNTVRLWDTFNKALGPVLAGHTGYVDAVAWSPDGVQLASGARDKTARLWQTDGTAGPVLQGHTDSLTSVGWNAKGTQLASASVDGTVRLWESDGKAGPVLQGHTGSVNSLAWNPNAKFLASAGDDGTIRLWSNVGTPGPVLTGPTGRVWSVAWNSDGGRLASAGEDRLVWLWKADGTLTAKFKGHTGYVHAVAWNPNGKRIASGARDKTIRVWDADSGEMQWVAVVLPQGKSATFSGSGELLHGDPVVLDSEIVYVLESENRELKLLQPSEFHRQFRDVRASTVERRTTNADHSPLERPRVEHAVIEGLSQLDPESIPTNERYPWQPKELVAVLGSHRGRHWGGRIMTAVFSPDGTLIASCGGDGTVRLWETESLREITVLNGHLPGYVHTIAFTPDGNLLASCGDDGTVRLWSIVGRQSAQTAVLKGHGGPVIGVAVAPNGKVLASASWDKTVRLWDLTSAKPQPTAVLEGYTDLVLSVAFAPDSQSLVSGSQNGVLRLWTLSDGRVEAAPAAKGHDGMVNRLAFSPDGNLVAAAEGWGPGRSVRLWRVESGKLTQAAALVGHGHYVHGVGFAPGGRSLASASADQTIRLWDLIDKEPVERNLLRGSRCSANSVMFTADGKTLVTAWDDVVRLWDLREDPPRERFPVTGDTAPVVSLEFSPDDRTLTTMAADGVRRVWDLAGPQPIEVSATGGQGRPDPTPSPTLLKVTSSNVAAMAIVEGSRVTLMETQSGKVLKTWNLNGPVQTVAFDHSGRHLAIGNGNGTIYILRL